MGVHFVCLHEIDRHPHPTSNNQARRPEPPRASSWQSDHAKPRHNMAATPRTSLAWQNIAKGLKLRGVLFDARSLQRTAAEGDTEAEKRNKAGLAAAGLAGASLGLRQPEALISAGNVKEMLQREIRDALKERGASSIGKRWEIAARLESLLAAERHEADLQDSGGATNETSAPAAVPPATTEAAPSEPSAASLGSTALRAKYADKLRSRAGVSLTSGGGLASMNERRMKTPDDQRPENSWHLQPGLKVLCTYLDMRGMQRGVLPSAEKVSDEEGSAEAAHFAKALQVAPFGVVLPVDLAAAARRGERSAIVEAITAFDLPPQALMVVSDEAAVLRAARQAGSFACHWVKRVPGAPQALPSDFTAHSCDGVKDAVEELNGVTFRDPDTEIRTKFGVYQT